MLELYKEGSAAVNTTMDSTIDFAHKVFKDLTENCKHLLYQNDSIRDLVLLSLYGTSLELYAAIVTLAKANYFGAVPGVLRELVEATTDTTNLVSDDGYYNDLLLTHLSKRRIKLQGAHDHPNSEFSRAFGSLESLRGELKELGIRESQLQAKGAKKLDPKDRFSKAGLSDIHANVYAALSSYSHHDLESLAEKHLRGDDTDNFRLEFFSDWEESKKLFHIHFAVSCLITCARDIHMHFTGRTEIADALSSEFNALKGSIA